jgi:hypothetical protein
VSKKLLVQDTEADPQQSFIDYPPINEVLGAGNDAMGQNIIGLADPVDPQDAATGAYVDAHVIPLATVLTAGNSVNGEDGTDKQIVTKNAGIVRASLDLSKTGVATLSVRDGAGVEVTSIVIDDDTLTISTASGMAQVTIGSDGAFGYAGPVGLLSIAADGSIALTGTAFTYNGSDVVVVP